MLQLFFEAGAVFTTVVASHLAIIRAYFGHGAIAPAMTNVAGFFAGSGEHFVHLGGNVHFFRPKIFAEI
jgi:hypothetical protein